MKNSISPQQTSGFTLIEVVVALGVFVIAITALMGVLPFGMTQVQAASNESRSLGIMEAVRNDIRLALETGMATSPNYKIAIPTAAGKQELELRIADDGRIASGGTRIPFKITGTFTRPVAADGKPDFLHLRASWPPKAPAGREDGSAELVAAFRP